MRTWLACPIIAVLLVGCSQGTVSLASAPGYDQSFLSDYTKLKPRTAGGISDAAYVQPDIADKAGTYHGIMIDQPEVLISPASEYRGAKPDDLAKVAENLRIALSDRLTAGGYHVVQEPGAGILYLRMGLSDLKLRKKKRKLLQYTPIGAVVKAGADALRSILEKYDITGMTVQGEILDSTTNEVLGALVVPWPGDKERIEFGDLNKLVSEYGERIRCNLDNGRRPADRQIDCLDPKARAKS